MRAFNWCRTAMAAASFLVLALSGSLRAQDQPPAKHDGRALRDSLKEVINIGADLFNKNGDHAGCYRVYQGALLSVKPFLPPALQKEIDDSIAISEKMPKYSERAFELRKTIDDIRAFAGQAPTPKKVAEAKMPSKIETKEAPKSLWARMGGEPGVQKVVEDFFREAGSDPKVNLSRNGKYKFEGDDQAKLQRAIVKYLSSVTGGPLKYTGKSMKEVHKGMGITNTEYNAAGQDLLKVLEANNLKPDVIEDVMNFVASLRKDIVEPKKKQQKKDGPPKDSPKKEDLKKLDGLKEKQPPQDVPEKIGEPRKVDTMFFLELRSERSYIGRIVNKSAIPASFC